MDIEHNQATEINVTYQPDLTDQKIILCSSDAHKIVSNYFPKDTIALQERFVVIYLNRGNRVLGIYPVSTGGITGTVADPRLILGVAVKIVATAIMLAHNHPSGSLNPSKPDIDLTHKIKEAGRYLDIQVLDHLIISPVNEEYYSFADEGLI
jgi:DNA repair protein RadC